MKELPSRAKRYSEKSSEKFQNIFSLKLCIKADVGASMIYNEVVC